MSCRSIAVLGLCCLLFSCQSSDPANINSLEYFDFPDFIEQERKKLHEGRFGLKKVLSNKDRIDSIIQTSPDWQKELMLFQSLDINKPAFLGRYFLSSKRCNDSLLCETYTALDSTLLIRKMTIKKLGQKVQAVYVLKDDHAMFLDNRIEVNYYPSQGFDVKGYRSLLGFDSYYEVRAKFLNAP